MPLPDSIRDRIELFARNEEQYRDSGYKEAQLRQEFLDPLFAALGWDMDNKAGHAESYKDVVHEDAIKIGGETKAPDYSFRIGGTRKFFVEAKKPAVLIKDDPEPAYQLRRYSWSAKLPLGILTDFQEFAIYDTRVRPVFGDRAHTARLFYCTYRELPEKWDEIAGIFAKDSVLRGSFDKYAAATRGKRGTATVDIAFLEEIERWRDLLARHLALRNESLSQRDLNFAVQRLIDRLVFLRIAEDRGLEPFGQLQALTAGNHLYRRLCELFERADYRYNSGLFHFEKDSDCSESPDRLSLRLELDDAPLKDVLKNLYYPASPYVFSVIPADILGSVYERFLGKVIHLTEGHRARIEEKPEVRKAGGVYYTPTYIVDYIVRQTVGTLVAGKTPKQIEKLRVLDPACGSGSFLIGAYQFLLDWHLDHYVRNDPEKWAKQKPPRLYQTNPNAAHIPPASRLSPLAPNWQLTTAERKRILLAHIHGVDIDPQAVEVTKLSLLLKVLEGEARETQGRTREMSAVLPDLGKNIKCGNSLVGHDFYAQPDLPTLDDEARLQLNTFDWAEGFPEIMRAGGFDAVIGNPPYIPLELLSAPEKSYLHSHFPELERKFDSSAAFILAFLPRLTSVGRLGFIAPQTWETGENYTSFRKTIFNCYGLAQAINLPFDVFKDAYVDTGVFVFTKTQQASYALCVMPKKAEAVELTSPAFTQVPLTAIQAPEHRLVLNPFARGLLARTQNRDQYVPLGDFSISTQGLAGNRFVLRSHRRDGSDFPFLVRGQARRYFLEIGETQFTSLSDKPSLVRFYEKGPKLLIRRVISRQDRLLVATTDQQLVFKKDINPFILTDASWTVSFVLGVLNSALLSWLYINTSSIATKDDFRQTTLAELRAVPIPNRRKGDKQHDRLVALVDTMLALHAKLATAQSPDVEENLRRQVAATDRAIDALVYALYGLTPEEIALVESATAPQSAAAQVDSPAASDAPPAPFYNDQAVADAAHFYGVKEDPPGKE